MVPRASGKVSREVIRRIARRHPTYIFCTIRLMGSVVWQDPLWGRVTPAVSLSSCNSEFGRPPSDLTAAGALTALCREAAGCSPGQPGGILDGEAVGPGQNDAASTCVGSTGCDEFVWSGSTSQQFALQTSPVFCRFLPGALSRDDSVKLRTCTADGGCVHCLDGMTQWIILILPMHTQEPSGDVGVREIDGQPVGSLAWLSSLLTVLPKHAQMGGGHGTLMRPLLPPWRNLRGHEGLRDAGYSSSGGASLGIQNLTLLPASQGSGESASVLDVL